MAWALDSLSGNLTEFLLFVVYFNYGVPNGGPGIPASTDQGHIQVELA
jgi:hypothetical protein